MKATFAALIALFAVPASDTVSLIRGNSAFAIALYQLKSGGSDNIFFSPYSISTAIALVDGGARGTTASEIEKAMRFPFGGTKLTRAWAEVQNDVNRKREGITLLTANALWAAKDVEFLPEYLSVAGKDFGAKLETVDFAKSDAA